MADYDYNKLLKRVVESTPKREVDDDRFKLPKAEIFYEGNTTVIKNFDKISDAIRFYLEIFIRWSWNCR
jgi:translation initiation factor 2 beta subunit (eIF-2beta)/eIF-5